MSIAKGRFVLYNLSINSCFREKGGLVMMQFTEGSMGVVKKSSWEANIEISGNDIISKVAEDISNATESMARLQNGPVWGEQVGT